MPKLSYSDAIRMEAQAGRDSLWYFLGGVRLPDGRRSGLGLDVEEHVHKDVIDSLNDDDWDEHLIMAARGTFKSTVYGCGYAAWRFAQSRNFRMMMLSSTFDVSQDNVSLIEQMLESEWFEEHYGIYKNPKDWSKEGFTVLGRDRFIREPSCRYKSRVSFKPGGHCDWFWTDDIEDQDTYENEDTRADTQRKLGLIYPMTDEPGARMTMTGTFWGDGDAHCAKEKALGVLTRVLTEDGRERFKRISGTRREVVFEGEDGSQRIVRVRYFYKPAINPDGSALFPEKLSLAKLEWLRTMTNMTSAQFNAQYLLDPVAGDDGDFPPWVWEGIYQPEPCDENGTPLPHAIFYGIDAAQSRRYDGDYTSIVGVKVYSDFRRHIFRATRHRVNGEELAQLLISIGRMHPRAFTLMEEDNYVAGLRNTFRDRFLQANIFPTIEYVKAGSRTSKDARIRAYKGWFHESAKAVKAGQPRTLTIEPGMTVLEDEGVRFPVGDRKDTLDALGNAHEAATVTRVREQIDAPGKITHDRVRKFKEGTKRWFRRSGGPQFSTRQPS